MKKLVKLALVGALVFGVSRMIQVKKAEWDGLTESEVRAKLSGKLGGRVPDDKLSKLSDTVVDKLRARGRLGEDEPV